MSVTQTVEVPASHRLVIDVPHEIPAGQVILTFTPAVDLRSVDRRSDDRRSDQAGECAFCAAHRDPVTGNPLYKPEIYESMREVDDMLSGKIPSTLRSFNSFEEMWEDLMRDEPDDMDD